jgi:hypothetical protein
MDSPSDSGKAADSGAKEPIMTAIVQTEKSDVRELSLEEMEQVSGGETILEFVYGCLAMVTHSIYKGPLR